MDSQTSKYYNELVGPSKVRYSRKIQLINGIDPYALKSDSWRTDVDSYPAITYPDIVMYLTTNPSPYSLNDFKAYKSLEAYNQCVNGWVKEVKVASVENHCVVLSRVLHSQRLNERPVKTWIIATKEGDILSTHCDCMAGLDESCTHIAATLFFIELNIRHREDTTCTGVKAYWLAPHSKEASYKRIKDLDFTSAKTQKRQLYSAGCSSKEALPPCEEDSANDIVPSPNELFNFLNDVSACGTKPAILSLVEPFSDLYVPNEYGKRLPALLPNFYNKDYLKLDYDELLLKCEEVYNNLLISKEQATFAEEQTRGQASNSKWMKLRSGRITASNSYAVLHTSSANPSKSLVKRICYPDAYSLCTDAVKWGQSNEKKAIAMYEKAMKKQHLNFELKQCGLFISTKLPCIGASPDVLVTCDCCGNGVVEVKCPFKFRSSSINDAMQSKDFYLKQSNVGITLKKIHPYYYQIQQQLNICKDITGAGYGDFVVWTEKGIFIQRILPDSHHWDDSVPKLLHFFRHCILPEIVGKFYSHIRT